MSGLATIMPLLLLAALVVIVIVATRRSAADRVRRAEAELEPVRQLAFEDVTALGTDLQDLDADLVGRELDPGATSDYQRALDAYEAAKQASERIATPDDVGHVTTILDDGRYAIASVRARVAGEPLPMRRPPCFFDPRHGTAVTEVSWAPPGGAAREVPSCALDAERVRVGAEPDVRQVLTGSRRTPYWEGGPAHQSYAAGYFSAAMPMNLLFAGLLLGGMGGMNGGVGDAGSDVAGGDGGDPGGDASGDAGGWDGGDGGGFDFGGFGG